MEAAERKILSDRKRYEQRKIEIANGEKSSHDHNGPAYAQPGHVSERGAQDKIAMDLYRCTRLEDMCEGIRVEHDRRQNKPTPTQRWEEKRAKVWKGQVLKAPSNSPPVPLDSPLLMSFSPPIVPTDASDSAAAAAAAPAPAPRSGPAMVIKEFLSLSDTDDDDTSDCEITQIRTPQTQLAAPVTADADERLAASPKSARHGIDETKQPDEDELPLEMSTPRSAAATAFLLDGGADDQRMQTQGSAVQSVPAPAVVSLEEDSGPCPMDLTDEQPKQTRALSSDGPDETAQGATDAVEVKAPEGTMPDAAAGLLPQMSANVAEGDGPKSAACVSLYDQVVSHFLQAPSVRARPQEEQQRFFQFAWVMHDPNQLSRAEQIKQDSSYAGYMENLSRVQEEIQSLQQQAPGLDEAPAEAHGEEQSEFGDGTNGHAAAPIAEPVFASAAAPAADDQTNSAPSERKDALPEAMHVQRRLARRTPGSAGTCELQSLSSLTASCSCHLHSSALFSCSFRV